MDHDFNLRCALRLAFVPRWPISPMIKDENVAAHSHGVGAIVIWLWRSGLKSCPVLDVNDYVALLELAIEHDGDEAISGDIANVAKRSGMIKYGERPQLFPEPSRLVKGVLKLADVLHMVHKTALEYAMGNAPIEEVHVDAMRALAEVLTEYDFLTPVVNEFLPVLGQDHPEASKQASADRISRKFLGACNVKSHPGLDHMNKVRGEAE